MAVLAQVRQKSAARRCCGQAARRARETEGPGDEAGREGRRRRGRHRPGEEGGRRERDRLLQGCVLILAEKMVSAISAWGEKYI